MFNRQSSDMFPTVDALFLSYAPAKQQQILRDTEEWRRDYSESAQAKKANSTLCGTEHYLAVRDLETLDDLVLRDFNLRLRGEACLLFRPDPTGSDTLVLERAFSDVIRLDIEPLLATFTTAPDDPTAPRLHITHRDHSSLQYLLSDEWYTAFDVPLRDRQSTLHAVIRVVRSRDTHVPFTEADSVIAALLADKFTAALNHLRTPPSVKADGWLSTILQELDAELGAAPDELGAVQVVLRQAARLVHADRADLALWDKGIQDLVIRAQFGKPVPSDIGIAFPVPTPSFIREVWYTGGHRLLHNVHGSTGYYPADPETKSELVFRFDWNDKAVGVLNVESYRESGFCETDITLLRLLSQYASSAIARASANSEQLGLLAHLTQCTPPDADVLKLVLRAVNAYLGYDAGLVYYADFAKRRLTCAESLGCDDLPQGRDVTRFSFTFDEHSLACKVFHSKQPYFCEDAAADTNVSAHGVAFFQIQGPLVGVPLVYDGRAVGVLVVWSRHGTSPHRGTAAHLEPFVQVAAPSIAAKADGRLHDAITTAAQDILNIRQTSISDEDLLRRACEYIHKAGFDRVRLFKYDAVEGAFVGCVSEGMVSPDQFSGVKILQADNPYAGDTVATAITNPRAREYRRQFGQDPDAARLEKSSDIAWLVAPLVVHQRLYGQIVVDNASTGRAFERRDFEYLNLLSTLLAETLANVESMETMRQRALPVLLRHLHIQDSLDAFIRRFLVFSTSGRGLGFSRAVFLQFDRAERRLGPYDAIGSITPNEFERIAKELVNVELDEQLLRSQAVCDEPLNLALQDLSFILSDEQRHWLFDRGRAEGSRVAEIHSNGTNPFAPLAQVLAQRIGGTHFLVAALRAENALSGMLVVDRRWQERHIGGTDHAQLDGFIKVAEFLLADHARTRQFMQWLHDDAFVGQLTRTCAGHIESTGLRQLARKVNDVRGQLIAMDYATADSALDEIQEQLATSVRAAERAERLWRRSDEPRMTHPRMAIADVVEGLKERLDDAGVECHMSVGGEVGPLVVHYEALWRALYAVLLNAVEAVEKVSGGVKRIDIGVHTANEYLHIEIVDSGPGIADEVLQAHRFNTDAFTTDPKKGLGFGLMHAQMVVERTHGGCFEIMRCRDREGTRVLMRLPLDGPRHALLGPASRQEYSDPSSERRR